MAIRRAPSEARRSFTVVPNQSITDRRLTWEATGLLVYLLSKPDNWIISPAQLIKERSAGSHRVYRILRELEQAGYIREEQTRSGGRFGEVERVVYDVCERQAPSPEPDPEPKSKQRRKPDPLFDAVAEACSIDPRRITGSARGAINQAVKELREIATDPAAVASAAKIYRERYPDAALTPSALAKHYPSLTPPTEPRTARERAKTEACERCSGTGWVPIEGDEHTVVSCPECRGG